MLDGLLGRSGFYSKCKSLIKQTRTRIEVVKRKRNATTKFLRKDIADLLANNLDSNAFARADALIAELVLSSCYEFVDHVCELVLKHLPALQKLRDCPEDCREAVASLMFAAARLSDLPELRDLRNLFQERYGSSLEFYVNQKLVDNITAKPPTVEKKIQLLQDIALEFSIRWDGRKFQAEMSNSVTEQKLLNSPGTINVAKNKIATPPAVVAPPRTVKDVVLNKKHSEAAYQNAQRDIDGGHQMRTRWDDVPDRKDDLKHKISKTPTFTSDRNQPLSHKKESTHKLNEHDISFQRREYKSGVRELEKKTIKDAIQISTSSHRTQNHAAERGLPIIFPQRKPDSLPTNNGINELVEDGHAKSPVNNELAEDGLAKSLSKRRGDVPNAQKINLKGGIPPPYMKPTKNKHKTDDENDTLTFNPDNNGNRADKLHTKAYHPDVKDGASSSENGDVPARFTEIYYKDESTVGVTPKRRSHRRRHSRSSSTKDDELNGEDRVIRRVSTSRRKNESKKGLQILVADDDQKDEEEKMIDKLLLHYSKKPPSGDPGKPRRKTSSSKSPHHHLRKPLPCAIDDTVMDIESTLPKSRSFSSLPSEEVIKPKQDKVFTRAASFQQDTPAKHVHPKLPDYDDLAARFAALRASKD